MTTPAKGLRSERNTTGEQLAMDKLLCAIHNKAYAISGFKEFQDLVRLADFYCALPVLSTSLYAILWNSPNFVAQIGYHPLPMLKLAKKLRHPVLFRESMIHFVSNWDRDPEQVLLQNGSWSFKADLKSSGWSNF